MRLACFFPFIFYAPCTVFLGCSKKVVLRPSCNTWGFYGDHIFCHAWLFTACALLFFILQVSCFALGFLHMPLAAFAGCIVLFGFLFALCLTRSFSRSQPVCCCAWPLCDMQCGHGHGSHLPPPPPPRGDFVQRPVLSFSSWWWLLFSWLHASGRSPRPLGAQWGTAWCPP